MSEIMGLVYENKCIKISKILDLSDKWFKYYLYIYNDYIYILDIYANIIGKEIIRDKSIYDVIEYIIINYELKSKRKYKINSFIFE